MVMMSPYWMHRDPVLFPDPEAFKPVSHVWFFPYLHVKPSGLYFNVCHRVSKELEQLQRNLFQRLSALYNI